MKKYFLFLTLALVVASCKQKDKNTDAETNCLNQTELIQLYDKADSLYHQGIVNEELMLQFVDEAEKYANANPDDTLAIDMLYKSGIACMIVGKQASMSQAPDQAKIDTLAHRGIAIFDRIQQNYPTYKDVKNCYLNRAFIYDDILHKYLDAEYEYRDYIHLFPEDTATCENLRIYLRYMGKDDEEIYAEIESKNKENQQKH